jgi:hypothetical protein
MSKRSGFAGLCAATPFWYFLGFQTAYTYRDTIILAI